MKLSEWIELLKHLPQDYEVKLEACYYGCEAEDIDYQINMEQKVIYIS